MTSDPLHKPWYETAFDREYLRVYAHRSQAAARAEAQFILDNTPANCRRRVLDIACGPARHLLWLCGAADYAVGVDLSPDLLAEAAIRLESVSTPTTLICADMRQLPFDAEFTLATLLFTSFGYFPTDRENLSVIQQASKALTPGGVFWLDYINEPQLRATLQPHSRHTDGDRTIEQHRKITDDNRVEKQIRITTDAGQRTIHESVKLYTRDQIEQMFTQSQLSIKSAWGDFDGQPHTPDSPRLIIMGAKDE